MRKVDTTFILPQDFAHAVAKSALLTNRGLSAGSMPGLLSRRGIYISFVTLTGMLGILHRTLVFSYRAAQNDSIAI